MKHIIAWVPENKKKELIEANQEFNIPLIFVDSILEIEKQLDGYAIFYPPLVVNNNDFISILKKYPIGTFNPICDLYVFDFETTTMLINLNNLLPDNPNIAEVLIRRFLEINIR
jgi:phosphoenolpyruvate synthase/pyruvate phosphate dikinase